MPKVDKKRSDAKTTPYKKLAQAVSRIVTSASQVRMARCVSPTPPPSPGAEERAQEEWILAKQADLQKNIGKMQASVLAAQQTLQDLQPIFVDSSSEDSDAESDSEKSTEY